MKAFNLTEWALTHRAFTGFIMALLWLGGIFAYFMLEQSWKRGQIYFQTLR